MWLILDIKISKDEKLYDDQNKVNRQTSNASPSSNAESQHTKKLSGENYASLIKLQKMKVIDKLFNVGFTESIDSINFDKYCHKIGDMADKCRQISNQFNSFTSLDVSEKNRSSNAIQQEFIIGTAKQNLQGIYDIMKCQQDFSDGVSHFQQTNDFKNEVYLLTLPERVQEKQQTSYLGMLKDFDKLENFIFDFAPFVEKGESNVLIDQNEVDNKLSDYMSSISSSLKFIYSDETRKHQYREKKVAYKLVADFLEKLKDYQDHEYEDKFKEQRNATFGEAIQVLLKLNKKQFLNGFNLKYLSLSIEHSMQNNYLAYQTLKSYLKDKIKAKILVDLSQIAILNDINAITIQQTVCRQHKIDLNVNNTDQEIININQADEQNLDTENLPQEKNEPIKYNHIYDDMFVLLNNSEIFDKRGKQSLLKQFILKLENQIALLDVQIVTFQNILNKKDEPNISLNKIQQYCVNQLETTNNEKNIQDFQKNYEKSFIGYNKLNNMKQIDQIMAGSIQFLFVLEEILDKEQKSSSSGTKEKQQTNFLIKLQNDLQNVQRGLKVKAKAKHDEMLNLSFSQQQNFKKKVSSPQNQKMNGGTRNNQMSDNLYESDMKDNEQKIIEYIINSITYQQLFTNTKQCSNIVDFFVFLTKKIYIFNKRRERFQDLSKYCNTVVWSAEDSKSSLDQEEQVAARNNSRGANFMMNVLSGNIIDQIDIYEQINSGIKESTDPSGNKNKTGSQGEYTDPAKSQAHDDGDSPEGNSESDSLQNNPQAQINRERVNYSGIKSLTQLSPVQRGMNYLVNYLNQLCTQEDQLSQQRILKNCQLFQISNIIYFHHSKAISFLSQIHNERYTLINILNLFEIQQTPIQNYLQAYEKQKNFVKIDLFQMLYKSNQKYLNANFEEIISKKGSSLVKQIINKVDELFCEAVLQDEEKTDFSNAQTKIRRKLDSDLKIFREYLDNKVNKKLTEMYDSQRKQQNIKLLQSVSSLQLIVRIYYLKQMQQHENLLSLNEEKLKQYHENSYFSASQLEEVDSGLQQDLGERQKSF